MSRRNRTDLLSMPEFAIINAIQMVEKLGTDELIIEAVELLSRARNKVADYIDSLDK